MGGLEPNTLITFAAISGAGKSSIANMLESDLIDLNPSQDIIVLSLNFEMLSFRQIGRKLSNKLQKTTAQLYSGVENEKLSDLELKQIHETAEKIKQYPVYYCDIPGTIQDIEQTIRYFQGTIAKDK
jgi:replicative DNA helicase